MKIKIKKEIVEKLDFRIQEKLKEGYTMQVLEMNVDEKSLEHTYFMEIRFNKNNEIWKIWLLESQIDIIHERTAKVMYGMKFIDKGDTIWIGSKEQRDKLVEYYLTENPQMKIEKVEKEVKPW